MEQSVDTPTPVSIPVKQQNQPAILTVTESISYHSPYDDAIEIGDPYCVNVYSEEQVYSRRIKMVPGKLTELDMGWIKDASLVHIHHIKPVLTINPTKEQQRDSELVVVNVHIGYQDGDGYCIPISRLHQGQSLRLPNIHKSDKTLIQLSVNMTIPTQVLITIFPKSDT